MAGRWEAGMQCGRVCEKAPNKHLLHFLIISNYNHVSFFCLFPEVGGGTGRKKMIMSADPICAIK